MRLLGWVFVQYDWYPYSKTLDIGIHAEKMSHEDEGRYWSNASISKRMSRLPAIHQRLRGGHRTDSFSHPSEGISLSDTFASDF